METSNAYDTHSIAIPTQYDPQTPPLMSPQNYNSSVLSKQLHPRPESCLVLINTRRREATNVLKKATTWYRTMIVYMAPLYPFNHLIRLSASLTNPPCIPPPRPLLVLKAATSASSARSFTSPRRAGTDFVMFAKARRDPKYQQIIPPKSRSLNGGNLGFVERYWIVGMREQRGWARGL